MLNILFSEIWRCYNSYFRGSYWDNICKKTLREADIEKELKALKNASKLCKCENDKNQKIRGPFLALICMDSFEKKKTTIQGWILKNSKCI